MLRAINRVHSVKLHLRDGRTDTYWLATAKPYVYK